MQQSFVNGKLNGNHVIIFFTPAKRIIKVKIGEVYFFENEFSALEKEELLKEIDKNNCDVI